MTGFPFRAVDGREVTIEFPISTPTAYRVVADGLELGEVEKLPSRDGQWRLVGDELQTFDRRWEATAELLNRTLGSRWSW